MKTTHLLLLCWGMVTLAAAKKIQSTRCSDYECTSHLYDDLLKLFEVNKLSAVSEEISKRLAEDVPSPEEWTSIINVLSDGKQPDNLDGLRLSFLQNETGVFNYSSGMTLEVNNKIYGKIQREGNVGSYSVLNFNIITTKAPEAVVASGLFLRLYFSVVENAVTWNGIGQSLASLKKPNGSFVLLGGQTSGTKGRANQKWANSVDIKTNTFTQGKVGPITTKILTNLDYSLDFKTENALKFVGSLDSYLLTMKFNTSLDFEGVLPRHGSGHFEVHTSGNGFSPSIEPIAIEAHFEGYTPFDSDYPLSDANLANLFNSQFWGAINY